MALDITKIQFPSDGLRIEQIRKFVPEMDDPTSDGLSYLLQDEKKGEPLGDMIDFERIIAAVAYYEHTKDPEALHVYQSNISVYEERREGQIDAYIKYGLAMGRESAEQLIQGIERQARAQGRSFP